jgi:DNA-binding SARP family transcriptional activator
MGFDSHNHAEIKRMVQAHEQRQNSTRADRAVLAICLLGQFQATEQDELPAQHAHARLHELIALVLLHRNRPLSRQQLAATLWPESTDEQSRTNLRNLLHRLRRTLPHVAQHLIDDDHFIRWREDLPYQLDIDTFEQRCAAVPAAGDESRLGLLTQAAACYGGALLPDCYSDWVLSERERLHQLYLLTLRTLAATYEAHQDYASAITPVQALLQHDPLDEATYCQLIRLHTLNDSRSQALQAYHACAEALRRELGITPGPEIEVLRAQLLQTVRPIHVLPALPSAPLIGRSNAWQALTARWRAALSGTPSLRYILISGEAGIGKTLLAETFADWLRRQGGTVAVAHCFESAQPPPYAPLVAWLRACELTRLPERWQRELVRLVSDHVSPAERLPTPGPLHEAWQRIHFHQALAHAFERQPGMATLLLLDDIQWCDAETLAWLAFFAHHPVTHPVVVLATARAEALPSTHAAARLLGNAAERLDISLDLLSPAATAKLVAALAPHAAGPEFAARVHEITEGNPLFIHEVLRAGVDHLSGESLPEKMRAVLAWRLARLLREARQLLTIAAVIGQTFSYSVLAQAAGLSDDAAVEALDECWQQRVIREQGSDGYDFSHEKLREVVYAALSAARRRLLHARVARTLEATPERDPGRSPGMIGAHWAAAGKPSEAITCFTAAANEAQQLFALQDAIAYLLRALDLVPVARLDPDAGAALYEQLGDLYSTIGSYEQARAALDHALSRCGAERFTRRGRLWRRIGSTWFSQQNQVQAAIALAMADQALYATSERSVAWWHEWLDLSLSNVNLLYLQGENQRLAALCVSLQAPMEQHGTVAQRADLCSALVQMHNRLQRFAPSHETVRLAQLALELSRQGNNAALVSRKTFSLGFQLLCIGDIAAATEQLDLALTLASAQGHTALQCQCLTYLAIVHRLAGHLPNVRDNTARSLALAEAERNAMYIGVAQANLCWLAYRAGDAQIALAQGREALSCWQGQQQYALQWLARWPLLALAVGQNDRLATIEHASALLAEQQQQPPPLLAAAITTALTELERDTANPPTKSFRAALDMAHALHYL